MRFPAPFHLFNSAGRWIGFCDGENLYNPQAVWRGWFPWTDSHNAVKADGTYLGTVVGIRFYHFEHKQQLRIRALRVCPDIIPRPPAPKSVSARQLFEDVVDIDLNAAASVTWQRPRVTATTPMLRVV